ncbi:MAG: hypothetical protein ACR2PF_08885 [Rhizobiaceae bacterium]
MTKRAEAFKEFGPWNPGLGSAIPKRLIPQSTMFRNENVETGFEEAHELADFCGLPARETVAFRVERLIVHELLVRVTADFSVPDGPDYEELGINMRGMVARIYEGHVAPRLGTLESEHKNLIDRARDFMMLEWKAIDMPQTLDVTQPASKPGILDRLFGSEQKKNRAQATSQHNETSLHLAQTRWSNLCGAFEASCGRALLAATRAVLRTQGRLPADKAILTELATNLFSNDYGSVQLGVALGPIIEEASAAEGYRFLPAQTEPIVMNVKGASAAGKSTIRPHQRELARKLGVPWEDFALISPDYWRKYLLDYESLGADYKYGAMLTGHELEIIDRKLDRYMAEKADRGSMPHLLIDRFRFDSFTTGNDREPGSNLLTRFGHTVFMFFMITPPEATVERAWKRGLTTGRYKAVDDLLDHNIEAYSGMPALFFAWALSDKQVHFEFLDNSVPLGCKPKNVSAGWNDVLTVFDIPTFLEVEKFKKINVDAQNSNELISGEAATLSGNTTFLDDCANRLSKLEFAEANTGRVYGVIEGGKWTFQDRDYVELRVTNDDTIAGLMALSWGENGRTKSAGTNLERFARGTDCTLGDLGFL